MELQRSAYLLNGRIHDKTVLNGGTGNTYRAILHPNEIAVAVKVFRAAGTWDYQINEHILREVEILASLEHNNVLSILGIATDLSGISPVTPWKEQGNIHDYVQNEMVDPRPLLRGIADGLSYLHYHNSGPIVHGNLKGTNVLVSDGSPLVTDMCCSFTSPLPTEDTAVWCAPRWTAPERFDNGGEATVEGDVWAFGMTILELLTRKLPFHSIPSRQGVMIRILKGPPERPSDESTHSRMTDEWWNLCLKCWEIDPASRPQMTDILDLLKGMEG